MITINTTIKKQTNTKNNNTSSVESDRVEDFKNKAARRFFATISAWIDKSFFENTVAHDSYNNRATIRLQNELKNLGLEYQKTIGGWQDGNENSFVVWNTAYTWVDFVKIILQLAKDYKQWSVCIGRKIDEKDKYEPKSLDELYDVHSLSTKSLDNIVYTTDDLWHRISPREATSRYFTILTRKIYEHTVKGVKGAGKIVNEETAMKNAVVFEEIEKNICLAASESFGGACKRAKLLKELLGE